MQKIAFILLILLNTSVYAQIRITGKIKNQLNTSVESAEILLISKDSVTIKSELSNEVGEFNIETKQDLYKLLIRKENRIFFSKNLQIDSDLDLGTITIDNSTQIEGVLITGKKKLIERKIDRLIFNVENSINASGGDALDMIAISPGVKVQNDKIMMIGKNTLSVMINDKILQLSDQDLSNYLKAIPSDDIKSIEIITNPPAKYEASGNSGLININLKKGKKDSWNALVGSSYLQRVYGEGSVMGNYYYNKNKLTISSSLNYKKGKMYTEQDDYAYFPDGLWYTRSPFTSDYARINGKIGVDYQLSPNWTVGSQLLFNNNNPVYTDNTITPVYDYKTNEVKRYMLSSGTNSQNPSITLLNLYNDFKLDSLGKKITVNLDYLDFSNKDIKSYSGISIINSPYSNAYFRGINKNDQNIKNLSGKIDVEMPIKLVNISFGGQVSNSKTNNFISAFNSGMVDNPISELPLSNTNFEYIENIEALYASVNKKINDNWESQIGLRMEATQTKTFSEILSQATKRNYIKFFPTAYISYTPNDNSTFTLSYSRRVDRPKFNDLNPNIAFINPFQMIVGNPFLQPAFIDNIEFAYNYKKLESKFYLSNEKNLFSQIAVANPDTNIISFKNENYINTQRYGISESYIFDKFKWWTSNNAIDVNYTISKSNLEITTKEQKGFNSRISTSNDFNLNTRKTLLINLNYWYAFPGIDGIYTNKAMSSLSFTIKYILFDKNMNISLRVNDLFRTEKEAISSTVNNVFQKGFYYHDSQSIRLSITYKFGNKKIKVNDRESGSEEVKNRTGI